MRGARLWTALGLALAAVGVAGCSSAIRYPRWGSPGPASYQRYVATQFDPYPQADVGPEVVGGRPRDYAVPPDEVTRSRQYRARSAAPAASPLPAAPSAQTAPAWQPAPTGAAAAPAAPYTPGGYTPTAPPAPALGPPAPLY